MVLLCIDDDLEDFELLREAVQTINFTYTCVPATNSEEGLAMLKKIKPAMVFLDINMPRKDGKEILKIIRQDRSLDEIPICIFSTSITPNEATLYIEMGANHCLQKPDSFNELCSALKLLFQNRIKKFTKKYT